MLTAYAATTQNIPSETATQLANLFQLLLSKIPLWIAAFILVVCTFIVAKIARRIVENKMAEKGIEDNHKEVQILGGRMTYVSVLTIGLTVALKIAGIDLTTIIAAVAFGVGFALKDMIMNFLAGVMILMGRHFTIGDFIDVGGTVGKVVEIQGRVTVLQAVDGTKVIVPNADLFKKQVTSFTSNPFRRLEIDVGVDYRGNLDNAMKICLNIAKHTKGVLVEPKPAVLITEFGENEVSLKIRVWVESKSGWLKIKSNLLENIKKAFDKYGVPVPWPMTQVVYDKDLPIAETMFEEEVKRDKDDTDEEIQPLPGPASAPLNVNVLPNAAVPLAVPVMVEEDDDKPLIPLGEQKIV
ncbi:MAG: mechanosensitive ion channel family protein [Patescibacteria group bacterium]